MMKNSLESCNLKASQWTKLLSKLDLSNSSRHWVFPALVLLWPCTLPTEHTDMMSVLGRCASQLGWGLGALYPSMLTDRLWLMSSSQAFPPLHRKQSALVTEANAYWANCKQLVFQQVEIIVSPLKRGGLLDALRMTQKSRFSFGFSQEAIVSLHSYIWYRSQGYACANTHISTRM